MVGPAAMNFECCSEEALEDPFPEIKACRGGAKLVHTRRSSSWRPIRPSQFALT
ncbi:uncharacterized protein TrAFT101_000871 [Trichoderma asperellum]|uniref:uncharacterized protein n=1 Tax=Trichoderma asperellum TaxID=101201 RepID=UPI003333D8E9|nr:hypothetical protein TrAFT101_000871 [Trichoderma asperellum]